ncbi:MAG: sugar ABC transporter permease [Planctomycetota bacterium]
MRTRRTTWLLLAPALAFYALFVLWPILQSIRFSLFVGSEAVGGHFARLLLRPDGRFFRALGNNVLLVLLSLLIQLPCALGLALLLSGRLPGRGVLRTIYFAPMVIPTVAIGFLWRFIYKPASQGGLLNQLLAGVGLGAVDWLGDPGVDLFAIILAVSWRYIGFHTVIFLAGLQAIPGEVYEAARIDGATEWEAFRDITLPMMRRVIAVSATLSLVGSLKYFDIFYVMSPGGGTRGSADLVTTYMYRTAFGAQSPGYGSAIAVALLAVTLLVAVPVMRMLRGRRVR